MVARTGLFVRRKGLAQVGPKSANSARLQIPNELQSAPRDHLRERLIEPRRSLKCLARPRNFAPPNWWKIFLFTFSTSHQIELERRRTMSAVNQFARRPQWAQLGSLWRSSTFAAIRLEKMITISF